MSYTQNNLYKVKKSAMSSLNTIFVYIELADKQHKFSLDVFEKLSRSKPKLIDGIIKSGLASFKVIKNDFTYYSSSGRMSNPIEFLKQYKNDIQNHEFYDEVEFCDEVEFFEMNELSIE